MKGGSLNGFPPDEFLPIESPSCPPSSGWWSKPLGKWVGKLIITYTMVGISAITGCLSLLVISWTTIGN